VGKILHLLVSCLLFHLLLSLVFLSFPQHFSLHDPHLFPRNASAVPATTNLTLQFSTYFGGSRGLELGKDISIAPDGNFYITGKTSSDDFPHTTDAFDSSYNGGTDAFLAKFAADGRLLWSTFFGGSDFDRGTSVATSSDGSCYIAGCTRSADFPTKNAYSSNYTGTEDVFLAKFSPRGKLLWSTYLGGMDWDICYSIAVAADGSCYVTGETFSANFPVVNAYNPIYGGHIDAFVAKFSSLGELLWSTYLGGSLSDWAEGLVVDSTGQCCITGITGSIDFPTTPQAFDYTHNGDWDVFFTKFSADGTLVYSSYLGGFGWDYGIAIAAAPEGSCYLAGFTASFNFPTLQAFNNTYGNWGDAFVAKFSADGSLLWSTFFGGAGADWALALAATRSGCYLTGYTFSSNFPVKRAFDRTYNGGPKDAFVSKFATNGSLLWSTYLGGRDTDEAAGIAVNKEGRCFVFGSTDSTNFPLQQAFDPTLGSSSDTFIAIFIEPSTPIKYHALFGFFVLVSVTFLAVLIYPRKKY